MDTAAAIDLRTRRNDQRGGSAADQTPARPAVQSRQPSGIAATGSRSGSSYDTCTPGSRGNAGGDTGAGTGGDSSDRTPLPELQVLEELAAARLTVGLGVSVHTLACHA
ncbi:hypothetical protein AB0H18_39690, partial [Streptomyces sp. NPDC020766]